MNFIGYYGPRNIGKGVIRVDDKKKRDPKEDRQEKEEDQQDIFEEGYYHEIGQERKPNEKPGPGSEADQEYP